MPDPGWSPELRPRFACEHWPDSSQDECISDRATWTDGDTWACDVHVPGGVDAQPAEEWTGGDCLVECIKLIQRLNPDVRASVLRALNAWFE